MITRRPSVFISSTIQDFRDIRSALRYYLSSLGYDVYLSEFNDFPKLTDANTFEVALETLKASDFYILLVGSRVGGVFDSKEQVSITRQEYRTAYELAKQKRIRLVLLVRTAIWDLRNDRDALRDFLINEFSTQSEIPIDKIEQIANHPGPHANDPALLFDFLNEIAKTEEMNEAVQGIGVFPISNWVHSFSSFEDIVDVLRVHLNLSTPLSTIALYTNLKRELLDNLVCLTTRAEDGGMMTTFSWAVGAREHLNGDINDSSQMPGRYLRWAALYAIFVSKGTKMRTAFIDLALQTGQFLEFQKDTGEYISGLQNELLFQLRERIERFRKAVTGMSDSLSTFVDKYRGILNADDDVRIPNTDLLTPLALADIEQDIVRLSIALIRNIDGDESLLSAVKLNPRSPLEPEAEKIDAETPTLSEIDEWVRNHGEEYLRQ